MNLSCCGHQLAPVPKITDTYLCAKCGTIYTIIVRNPETKPAPVEPASAANVITIHTDGLCKDNQNADNRRGAWAAILEFNGKKKTIGGVKPGATNNEMELTAVVEALRAVHAGFVGKIELFPDSQYIADGANKWLGNWINNGWRTTQKKPVENRQLWEEYIKVSQGRNLTITWVPREKNSEADAAANQILLAA